MELEEKDISLKQQNQKDQLSNITWMVKGTQHPSQKISQPLDTTASMMAWTDDEMVQDEKFTDPEEN